MTAPLITHPMWPSATLPPEWVARVLVAHEREWFAERAA